jgi:hypothetical protein
MYILSGYIHKGIKNEPTPFAHHLRFDQLFSEIHQLYVAELWAFQVIIHTVLQRFYSGLTLP